ncbi:nitrate reductase molybdenum cofactor assembly chaperone [Cohnella hongkongensis]|uniref:Nitrate reductase molybdenum cofactor assembly chaperone n=1 Tax=Cohnella hongkongensis TaxID=178337 RepID=A0ABV9F7R5_9BACL
MNIKTTQAMCGLLSYLFQYPDPFWREQLPVCREEAQAFPDPEARRILSAFVQLAEETDDMQWQAGYVRAFDFGKRSNLYLTYAQHGDERERGPALLELKRRYAAVGLELTGSELPDYLPLVLEFAAVAPWDAAEAVLAGRARALQSIGRELAEAASPYSALIELLLRHVPNEPPAQALEPVMATRGGS